MADGSSTTPGRHVLSSCLAVTAAALLLTAFIAIRWGAFAVGGSDSHCYAGQARMLADGRVSLPPPASRLSPLASRLSPD